jgi:hypothetical protein
MIWRALSTVSPCLTRKIVVSIFAKLRNNAELEKHFWRNHAICPINKGNSGKNEESLKVGTKQIYAVR